MAERNRKKSNPFHFLTKKFPKRMQKKLVMLFMAIVLAFVVLIGRITYINVFKGGRYTKIVLDQQLYDSRTIPYKRGDIVDRNGTKIATSERVYNVILDVVVMTDGDDSPYVEPTIDMLEECFGIDSKDVREIIAENPQSRYQVLKKGVTYEEAQAFREIEKDTEKYPNIKGIWLEDDYTRTYPYGSLASDLIGFTVSGNQGALGLESAYNTILNGTDGREYGYFDSASTVEQTVKPAKNGNTVVSTIDVTLQSIVEKAIKEFNEEHAGEVREGEPGSQNTAVVMMDPNTGEILAMASYPNFDLNNPRDLSAWYSEEKLKEMSEEEQLEAMNELWRNFVVSDAFEPGSTIKPFTLAAGLEIGALTGEETYYCGGGLQEGEWFIRCHNTDGHGTQTTDQAIANSCNVALMQMAKNIGVENFTRYQHIFGFGEYTGIDLPGEADTSGLIYTADNMIETDLVTNSFGQNFNATMIQVAAGFSSLINGGYYYEPHVVKQIQDENGNVIETKDPILLRKTISSETSKKIKQGLRLVLTEGTGTGASVEGYDIGGKTGTAEKLPRGNDEYLISFIGYAPQENPEIVIYAVIDEPNVEDQGKSSYVIELSRKIMEESFPYLNITKTGATLPSEDAGVSDDVIQAFDSEYTDPYDHEDGAYIDETYQPDYDDWAATEQLEE